MKTIKRITAILLCLIMTLTLCACSASAKLKGDWEANADMTEVLSKELKARFDGIAEFLELEDLFVAVSVSFDGDGTYSLSMDISDTSREKIASAVREGVDAYIESYYAEGAAMLNLDMDGLRAMYEAQRMNLDDEMAAAAEEAYEELDVDGTIDGILADCASEGSWKLDGNKIVLSGENGTETVWTYDDLSRSAFTLTDGIWACPVAFEKK